MQFDQNKLTGIHLLESTIGIELEVLENEYQELPLDDGTVNSSHKIVFQITEEEPDLSAIGVLFCLALISFTYAAPRGYSFNDFIPDEEYNLGYFVEGLHFQQGVLRHEADYVSGRCVKTDITFELGGIVTISTRNRGRGADRWMLHLQGKKHIQTV
ncbi:hypothetical protein KP001_07825 [Geomonas subterranea]|uniref:Uncharacterized protein n=1 Tax=Geomonas subterranea TaxID=2847989 RepID=A0ABX8LK59_9BACT|nr:hypothetical protein [Geomonas subterranea]QXE92421.1 hypothetical protein KP001_07825 [Geomonas subterranea]QXM09480.1 hypothetical protein KP002_21445 [Geomonas subterranea]